MFGQVELVKKVLDKNAGMQVSIDALRQEVRRFFENRALEMQMRESAKDLSESGRGATERTLQLLKEVVDSSK